MKHLTFIVSLSFLLFACKTSQTVIKPEITDNLNSKIIPKTEPEKRGYWQQYVHYTMDIDMNTQKHQYTGKQTLEYQNNSYDTLTKVYYHLYWNAFQPNSAMAWKARIVPDPDRNMDKTLQALKPDEIGFIKVNSLSQDEQAVPYKVVGTILEVNLNKPILPGEKTTFKMNYLAQVPKMIRRAGRNNKEGIDYSMAQWYPKLCEYDYRGWHTDPYLAREFYGVWGDFDVTIHIDKKYMVASTGYLQNPEQVGKGYPTDKPMAIPNTDKLTWHFVADNVHDFSWAADPDYVHDIYPVNDDLTLHFFYEDKPEMKEKWQKLQPVAAKTMTFFNEYIGKYPYKKYSVIQAGDGGMEYAMCTFVTANKPYKSLLGTVQHEMGHAWFQFSLASNESEYPWMDEGFTSFAEDMANVAVNGIQKPNPFEGAYQSYLYLVSQNKEEPMSTHADYYLTNLAYWINAYNKGELVLTQLGYIMGFDKLNQTLKNYYKNWAMKHPQPD
ncbi:MAG TPA: M1 family peptidase, partial [Flavobacteriales bacterium]|nr:M1 family peptidase [Flavobacteriales bacterium]